MCVCVHNKARCGGAEGVWGSEDVWLLDVWVRLWLCPGGKCSGQHTHSKIMVHGPALTCPAVPPPPVLCHRRQQMADADAETRAMATNINLDGELTHTVCRHGRAQHSSSAQAPAGALWQQQHATTQT